MIPIRQAVAKKSLGNVPPVLDLLATRLVRQFATVNFIVGILQFLRTILKMADVTSKKRKSKDDLGSEKKKTKVASASRKTPRPDTIKISSVVQKRVAPPVVGMLIIVVLPR